MKRRYASLFYVGIGLFILASLPIPVYANIVNPGFESGVLSPWYCPLTVPPEGTTLPYVTNSVSHSGIYSATWVGNLQLRQNFDPIDTDLITEISFWSYQPELTYVALQVTFYYSDSTLSQINPPDSGTGWLKSDITSNLTSNKELVGFSVWGYSGAGSAEDRTYIDDVRIVSGGAVPIPADAWLLGSGLVGLVAIRRKFRK